MTDMMAQAQETFIHESIDLLAEMETSLNQLRSDPTHEELINSVFRAAHTIKGSAGLFGLDAIVAFTHKVENILDHVRNGTITVTGPLIDILLQCRDHIEALIEDIDTEAQDAKLASRSAELLAELQAGVNQQSEPKAQPKPASTSSPTTYQASIDRDESPRVENDNWHISLRFHQDIYRNGLDPLSMLRYLSTLGDITNAVTVAEDMPEAAKMDPESCYLGMEIGFKSDADKNTIMDVFEFIAADSGVSILPPHSKLSEYALLIEKLKAEDENCRIGDLLIKAGALTTSELQRALRTQQQHQSDISPPPPLGEVLVAQGSVHSETVTDALGKQKKIKETQLRDNKSIRVDAERLDQLINLVGELVIAGAGAHLRVQQFGDSDLQESVALISRLVEDIRDRSLRLRMVPVGETFSRFNRVVRDISKETGKLIQLVIEGAETELDKSVIEKIGDPLTHLVRNSIDHGIETAEQRALAGKPEQGTVRLKAYHNAGNIVIEVSDDGGGIDPEKVEAKAIANGLISAEQTLSRPEILRLILEAGLSTKDAVSNLSGRGVGMDVVKKNVELLRGSIDVESELGLGTRIRIHLPLTLSIIDGFLVGVGDATYVIPLDAVVECIDFDDADQVREHEGNYLNLRGEALPYLNLKNLFGEGSTSKTARENIVVVKCGDSKAGLMVDELMGEYQTVIKPLSKMFSKLSGISGSTILGSGDVAMILDVNSLLNSAEQRSNRPVIKH